MAEPLSDPTRPPAVWSIWLILLLQGTAVILTTVSEMISQQAQLLDVAGQVAMLVLYVLAGAVLILLGFRLLAGSAGARTPTLVLQLLIVVLSFNFFAGGAPLVGVTFLVPAGTVLVLLFVGPTQQWLGRPRGAG